MPKAFQPCEHALVAFGTRPEAIKLAPVINALRVRQGCAVTVCNTGQHRELLTPTLEDLGIVPDITLETMEHGQSLNRLFAKIVDQLDTVLRDVTPDTIIVQGDTATVSAGALSAFHRSVRVAHVEAGLRSNDIRSPFPEEANRRLVSVLADLHFAPTARAVEALIGEGVDEDSIVLTGNTGIDTLLGLARTTEDDPNSEPLVVITAHRRENFGAPLESVCAAILELARRFADHRFVWPLHLNPNARETPTRVLGSVGNIELIDPMRYSEMARSLARAALVLTDSGGIQEEAPSLGVPVLVMRESTERPEAVAAGAAELVGLDKDRIVDRATTILERAQRGDHDRAPTMVYGDGRASERIAQCLTTGTTRVDPFRAPALSASRP